MLVALRFSGWGRGGGDLESDVQRPRRRSTVAATVTAAVGGGNDDFKLVVFRIGNADFDLVARDWLRDLDLAGDAVE